MTDEHLKKYCLEYCGDDVCNCNLNTSGRAPLPTTSSAIGGEPSLPLPKVEEKVWTPPAEDDFGFSTVSSKQEEFTLQVHATRFDRVKELMFNFLDKLARDPERDIHWPNRDVKIQEFKDRIDRILRGDE